MAKRYKFSQDAEEIQDLLNKIDGLQVNQSCGCGTNCELENVELNDVVYSVITRAVNNLLNYYTKSETFTRDQIDSKISAIHQFSIKQVDVLPRPSAKTTYTLYLVPSSEQRTDNITDEFITVYRNGSYVWEQVGTSPVDLSHYVTDSQLNSVLSGYVTSQAFSSAVTNLSNRIDGLHDVKYTTQSLTDSQKSRARSNIGAGTYSKPSSGIPASDLANGVIPDVSQFITKTVNDLANYYTKSQTYTRQEVRALIGGSVGFTYVLASSLPEPTVDTMWKMYLIPSEEPKEANAKDEFITIDNGSSANPRYTWEQIGSTAIDLSGYVTTEALNAALADYVTSDALATALAGLHDVKYTAQSLTDPQKAQARTNIDVPSTNEMSTAIANADKVFVAVYGVTTYSELLAAYNAGKALFCYYNSAMYALVAFTIAPSFVFCCQQAENQYRIICENAITAANSWRVGGTSYFQTEIQDLETIRMGANRANGVIADSVEGITIEQRSGYYYNSSGTKTASSNSRYCSCQIVAGHYYFIEGRIGNPSQFGVSCPGTSQSPKTQPIDPSTGQKYASYIVADITASGKTGGYILIPNGVNTIQFTAAYNTQNATTIKLYDLGSTPQTQPIFSGEPYVIDLGRLNDLETTEKDTVVGALNEVVNGVSGRESKTNKVQTITGNESSQVKYPSTKAVADALATKYTKPASGIPASDLATGVIPDVSGKADKVQSATAGHLAGLNAAGNPTDTGLVPLDIPLFPNMDGLTPLQTIEYDLTKNEWCKLFERINPEGTVASDVTEVIACRVTVTGDNMVEPQVIDLVAMGQGSAGRQFFAVFRALTTDTSAANKYGIYQIRNCCPKALGSGYGWVVEYNPSYNNRHIKIEVFKTAPTVVFYTEHTKSNSSSTYQSVASAVAAYGTRLLNNLAINIDGTATSAAYITSYLMPILAGGVIKAGEALSTNQICFVGSDGNAYPVSNTVQAINPDAFVFLVGTDYSANTAISAAYIRTITAGITFSATTNPNVTIPRLVKGEQLFLRCHISNGRIYSDAVVTNAVVSGYTWISLGYASSDIGISLSTHGKEFFTLDANGKLTHINGREIAVPASGVQDVTLGGASVVSAGVAALPAYPEDQFHIAYYQSTTWAQVNEWIEDDNKPIILFAPGAYRNVTAIYCGTDDYGNHLFFSFDDYDNISKFVLGEQGWSTDVIEIQHLIDSRHKLDYSLLSNTPTIPTVESMTAQEVATAVATAWNNVIWS